MSGLFQLTPSASVTSAQRSKICHSPQFVLDLFLSGCYSVQPHFFMSFDNVSHLCICSSVTQLCGSLDRWISFPLLRFLIAYCSRTFNICYYMAALLTLPILGCSRLKQSCSKQFETFVGPRSMFLLIDINHFVSAETSKCWHSRLFVSCLPSVLENKNSPPLTISASPLFQTPPPTASLSSSIYYWNSEKDRGRMGVRVQHMGRTETQSSGVAPCPLHHMLLL